MTNHTQLADRYMARWNETNAEMHFRPSIDVDANNDLRVGWERAPEDSPAVAVGGGFRFVNGSHPSAITCFIDHAPGTQTN